MAISGSAERVDLELRDYLQVLRRRWKLIAVVALAATILGAVYTFTRTPIYEARATVLLDTGYSRTVLADPNQPDINLDAQTTTEVDLMRSATVLTRIEGLLGYRPSVKITPQRVYDQDAPTRAIDVTATDPSAPKAALEANDFAKTYVAVRRAMIRDDIDETIAESQRALRRLDTSTAASRLRLAELEGLIAAEPPGSEDRLTLEAERDRLNYTVDSARVADRQNSIQTRIDVLEQARRLNEDTNIFKINQARVPGTPKSPVPVRDIGISALVGLGLALIFAFLRDYYDDSVGTKEQLDRISGGIPVLGIIPNVRRRRREKAELESLVRPSSGASEAYRSLRTALEFTGLGKDLRLIHITSASPGEGKSTTACNLAVSLARAGNHVVLVDCDLRRPRVHEFLGVDNEVGFTSVLLGTTTMDQALRRVDDIPGLYVLPSGPTPPNPAEVLDSQLAESRLRLLAQSADYVIIDSPPVLPVSDSLALAGYTDATLMVVRARTANRRAINRAMELLAQVESPTAGMILNGVSHEATYGYGYGYGSEGYGRRRWRYGRSDGGTDLADPVPTSADRTAASASEAPATNGSSAAATLDETHVGDRS